MKWTKDGRYFADDRLVDVYDKLSPAKKRKFKWPNSYGAPEVDEISERDLARRADQ